MMEQHSRRGVCWWILLVTLVGMLFSVLRVDGELSAGAAINDTKAMDLLTRVMKSANPLIRPNVYGPPVKVTCEFYVQSLGPINEIDMDYNMEIYFTLRWMDERLSFSNTEPPLMVPVVQMEKLWVPDIYFPNEKSGREHYITTPNRAITVSPNGSIVQITRLTLRLECNMLLMSFPLDYQKCEIKISSYAFDRSQLLLDWDNTDPVKIEDSELSLPQFQLLNKTYGNCRLAYKQGEFTCLMAEFHLKREIGFYVLQTFIPSILIVMLSWVSFWISKDAVPARISLGVTTVLTMTTQLSSSRSNSMRVSYPKAIDVWYASCMLFVFGALLEYALINVLIRGRGGPRRRGGMGKGGPRKNENNVNNDRMNSATHLAATSVNDIEMQCPPSYATIGTEQAGPGSKGKFSSPRELYARFMRWCSTITPKGVDHASRTIFPSAFAVFNFIYWVVYTQPGLFLLPDL